MVIAITGGSGFLGSYLIKSLIKKGEYTPIIVSRRNINAFNGVEVRTTDYTTSSLTEILVDVDAVVHLAAKRGDSVQLKDYNINTEITQNIYEACKNNRILNIVYASSISVYSQKSTLPWHEKLPITPISMYGISKLSGEYLGRIYNRKYGLMIKNLRFAHLYGCNEKNDYMINVFMKRAYSNANLILFEKNKSKREFLYVKDAAMAIISAIEARNITGTFNIGSGQILTNQEVAENINRAFNNEGNLTIGIKEVNIINSSYMVSEKAEKVLGYKSQYSFYQAMEEIYKEIKLNDGY